MQPNIYNLNSEKKKHNFTYNVNMNSLWSLLPCLFFKTNVFMLTKDTGMSVKGS